MKSMRAVLGTELQWRKQRGHFELQSGGETIATLTRLKGSRFVAESDEGRWSFVRAGCFKQRVTVRAVDSDHEIGVLPLSWGGGGTLELPAGLRFSWRQVSFWRQEYAFQDDRGRDLVRARSTAFGKIRLWLDPAARGVRELPILALLGAYLTKLRTDDAAVAAAYVPVFSS